MIQVRQGVFETNSSSTHSITIVPKDEFEKWKRGEVYFNDSGGRPEDMMWLTKEQVVKMAEEDKWFPSDGIDWDDIDEEVNRTLSDELEIYTVDTYLDCDDYNTYVKPYTTESGDEIVIFGMYGCNY